MTDVAPETDVLLAPNALHCWSLTTDTGSIIELWELDNGEFELLFAEAHRRQEVVYALTLRLAEGELLSEKLSLAFAAARSEAEPAA